MLAGVRAGASMVTPNEREAEELVGQEFADRGDLATGLTSWSGSAPTRRRSPGPKAASPRSARAPSGACSRSTPSRWSRSRRSAPATPSWPATSPPATRAARAEECLAYGVACGAESTQHFGAGTVDRNQVERLLGEVAVHDLEVPAEV